MSAKEIDSAFPGDAGGYFFKATALIAVKTMPGWINMQRAIRLLCFDGVDLLHGDGMVLIAKMEHHGALGYLVNIIDRTAAVIR